MSMSAAEPFSPALVLSLVLHVAGAAAVGLLIHHAQAQPRSASELGASFAGETFDIDEVITSSPKRVATPGGEPAPAAAPPPPETTSAPLVAPPPPEPGPRPKPARPAEPAPAATPSAAATPPSPSAAGSATGAEGAASTESVASAAAGAAGPLGQSGVAGPTADFAKAFAKAVTAATHRDPLWDQLPLGGVGSARVVITVDDEGHLKSSELDERDKVPDPIQRLIERTMLFLQKGRFALSGRELGAGSQTLEIEVSLSSVEPEEDYDDPRHTVSLGFEPPRPGKPGRAYFVHAAGRRFDAKISVLP
jgi:hypothetical protein